MFRVFSRYPAFGFLSVSSQFVLNERVLWFFVWGHFVVNRPLGFCVFFRVRGLFAISGVWIFEICFAFVVTSARPMIFCLRTFCDESALGFCGFFLCSGVFSRYPAFGLLSFASQFVFNECALWFFVWGHL